MSQRTEPSPSEERPEFTTEYLVSLTAATAFVLILVYAVTPMIGNPLKIRGSMPWLYAWILAGGQTIANGLTEFSGEALTPVDDSFRMASLVSLLLVGVFAPTIGLLFMRMKTEERLPMGIRGLYVVGIVIAATFALTVLPTGFIGYSVRVSLRDAQAVQTNKDFMINELNTIAWKVREYRILPKTLGGGDGRTDGLALPPSLTATDEATYVVTPTGTGVTVEAASKRYAGAAIAVTIEENGYLRNWTYSGRFQ